MLLITLILHICSCASLAERLSRRDKRVQAGMAEIEVVRLWGRPNHIGLLFEDDCDRAHGSRKNVKAVVFYYTYHPGNLSSNLFEAFWAVEFVAHKVVRVREMTSEEHDLLVLGKHE